MTDRTSHNPNRRGLLSVASVGLGAGMAAFGGAQAATLPTPQTQHRADVIVIGGGMAGCAAALEATERGASVIVLDKAGRLGGNSILAAGIFALPLGDSAAARQDFAREYERIGQGRGNAEIFALMAEHVRENIAWLERNGVAFGPEGESAPFRVAVRTVGPGAWRGMPVLFQAMRERIEARGGRFDFGVKARELVMDNRGHVVGVRAAGPDGLVDYLGRTVVIAAGGYAANTAMLEAFADPNAGALMVRGYRGATGDGHRMAEAAGAGLRGMGGMMALHIAAVDPDSTAAGQPAFAIPHAISINRAGERFVDESRGYVAHGKAVLTQPQGLTTLVFDQRIAEIEAVAGVVGNFRRLGLDVHQADTIEALAAKVGLPPEATARTVNAFNAAVQDGAAPGASPPKRTLARKVEKAPFFALHPLVPGITLTFGGVMTDTSARVLEADGRVIPGLFAAGEGAGGAFFEDYIGGGALTMCLVMGRIAGRSAVA
ncbi:FAD-dependent oxidoreductase [Falsiroseomonas sp.]|uniref:FAD-dependent oxidoreductase n=1 Tax=Falsiroseomonas sp. TaxID=2870721 RepID=UPI002733AED5|nr:FAD-dependent oxidoreductase [Falsiroseomonas sp.]MDP3416538.1 FAD-dependent oxidoreductase [Falsiroseomonas sp.]